MSKDFIHIGFLKTGSTFLQEKVFPNLNSLKYVGSTPLLFNHGFNRLMYEDEQHYDESRFLEELSQIKSADKNFLLSSEWLVGIQQSVNGANRTRIAKRLQSALPNAEIILVIRGQSSLMRSFYNQAIKIKKLDVRPQHYYRAFPKLDKSLSLQEIEKGGEMSKHELYYYPYQSSVNPWYMDFNSLYDLYAGLFPKVHVLTYEELRKSPISFLSKFLSILELVQEAKEFEKLLLEKSNISITQKELQIKRISNKLIKITSNKYVHSLLEFFLSLNYTDKSDEYEKFYQDFSKKYYTESNNLLNSKVPEAGMSNFKEAYFLN